MSTKRKVKRYDGEDESLVDSRDYGGSSGTGEYAPEPAKPTNFKSAFAAARAAGDKTFEFGGKKYTTELASSKPQPSSVRRLSQEEGKAIQKAAEEDRYMGRLKAAGEKAIMQQQNENIVKAHKARIQRQKEANLNASLTGSKNGGSVSSRADGIASKGKTRGKYI